MKKINILLLTIILGGVGVYTLALGSYAHQAGYQPSGYGAIGDYSTATGYKTKASGKHSTAMGGYTTASTYASTAMGGHTTASGYYSTAMGDRTTASGWLSTAMGYHTTASGSTSTAMGEYSTASGDYQTVIGKYNISDSGEDAENAAFIIGNGNYNDNSNALVVTWNGKIKSNGNYPISDIRLKEKIKKIENPLDKILKLRGVYYYWKPEEKRFKGYGKQIGLIAQEVEKVVPELVNTDKIADGKGRYLKSVAYEKTVALLIEGMKEQQKEIEELKKRIKELEKK